MRPRRAPDRNRAMAAARLIDRDALCRGLSAVDPDWRSRRRLARPLHREVVVVLEAQRAIERLERASLRSMSITRSTASSTGSSHGLRRAGNYARKAGLNSEDARPPSIDSGPRTWSARRAGQTEEIS